MACTSASDRRSPRLELRTALQRLTERVPTLRLAGDLDELPFKHDALLYGMYALPVTW